MFTKLCLSVQALLSAYDNALDSTEANTILMHISLMEKVRVGFVIGMEERLDREIGDLNLARQLILVFASLATKGSDEVEDRVMNYLAALVTAETSTQNTSDVNNIILLVHALGNTGSKLSIAPIFSILDSSISRADYNTIKLAVIESLTKVTDDPMVLSRLEEIVSDSDDSSDCVATVIETLENGLEYVKKIGLETDEYLTMVRSHPLIYSLIETVASGNDSDLVLAMEHYLSILPGTEDHYNVLYSLTGSLRQRRGTYWAEANSDYDLVQGLSERQSDVSTFVRHSSYINSKRVGIDEANIKIAYGYFAGTNYHCDNAKAYARTRVVGTLLSHTSTFADVKVDIRATTTSASITAYAKVGSNYLLQHSASGTLSNHCFPYNRNLASYTTRLFRLSFSLFVYVAYLTLSVDVDAHFNMGLTTNMCIGRTGLEATGAIATLTPTVGVTVTGGVSANLLYLVRGGIDVSVTLNYRLEPAVSVQGCTARCSISTRLLLGVFDSYPDSGVNLYAWWQHQSAGFCGSGWFRYPCLKWSRKHTWDALSATWSLGRQSRRAIYEYCTGNFDPMCSSAALDSSIFTCN